MKTLNVINRIKKDKYQILSGVKPDSLKILLNGKECIKDSKSIKKIGENCIIVKFPNLQLFLKYDFISENHSSITIFDGEKYRLYGVTT